MFRKRQVNGGLMGVNGLSPDCLHHLDLNFCFVML